MSFNPPKPDIYEQVTSALIAALEEGAGQYQIPWHALSSPVNAGSRKPYRGINILLLWTAAQKQKYISNDGSPIGSGANSAVKSAKANAAR